MEREPEQWVDITIPHDFTGKYMISNYGRCKSLCGKNERILKPKQGKYNYLYYHLSTGMDSPRTYSLGVGKLVAEHFNVPGKSEYTPWVNHKDHDPTNNYVGNLEYVSGKFNCQYSQGMDYYIHHEETPETVHHFRSRRDAADFLKMSKGTIDYWVRMGGGKTTRGWVIKIVPVTGKEAYQQGL